MDKLKNKNEFLGVIWNVPDCEQIWCLIQIKHPDPDPEVDPAEARSLLLRLVLGI